MARDATPLTGILTRRCLNHNCMCVIKFLNYQLDEHYFLLSRKSMREDGGFEVIKKAILNLSLATKSTLKHMEKKMREG